MAIDLVGLALYEGNYTKMTKWPNFSQDGPPPQLVVGLKTMK